MTDPSPRYDGDAADVVTRTLRAVAATTPRRSGIGLAPGPIAAPPVPTRPGWLKWVGGAVAAWLWSSTAAISPAGFGNVGRNLGTPN